jgi:hypothetical protein
LALERRTSRKLKKEGAIVSRPVKNATELKPIVEQAVKALYGHAIQNTKILKADRFPLFKEPKEGWLVHAEFNDDKYEYAVQMDVQMTDGRITRSVELHRALLQK